VLRAVLSELALHEQRLDALDKSAGGKSVWRQLG
jgi:DNA polymerase-3 subunit epsilon